MHALTLLVRNLGALPVGAGEPRYPALESVFSRSVITTSAHDSVAGWICAVHGIERQQDWPAGPMLAQACGERTQGANDGDDDVSYWICAQPVHLAVERDSLILQPPSQLCLPEAESRALFRVLEMHFGEDQFRMKYVTPGLWCIGSRRALKLRTTEIERVQGRSVDGLLPAGEDATWWQRLVTEAQMILHDHPVNAAREQRGEAQVNSLWIWGGGSVPTPTARFDAMSVTDPLLRAFALLSGAQVLSAPADLMALPDTPSQFVECILKPGNADNASLSGLEANWMYPAWQALASGRLGELTLVLALAETLVICRCGRRERRRFWKHRRSLSGFLAQFSAVPSE